MEKATFGKYLIENKGSLLNEYKGQSLYGNAGVNWQISDSHSVGGKIEWGTQLQYDVHTVVNDNVFKDGVQTDKLSTISDDLIGDDPIYNLGANLYYNGKVQKWGIDVNLDYYDSQNSTKSVSREGCSMTHDAEIHSTSNSTSKLYAGKLVLSYPIWKGQLQVGTEETFSRRDDNYAITGISIPASEAQVKEDNYAGFATYAFYLPKFGQVSAGARYEHVHYAYEDALTPENDLTRNYSNLFPTLSYAGQVGKIQLMLNYSAKTRRPNYANLSSAIRYNSRYI